jgi:sorting and assembly machinery component 37
MHSSAKNYELVHRHLASSLPFPQSHYLPSRIRALHEARLTHVGLWQLGAPEETSRGWQDTGLGVMNVEIVDTPVEASAKERKKMTSGKFGEAELLARAKQTLDLLADVLGSADFFFNQPAPSTVDLALFAQLALILLPPWPEPLLADLVRSTYPTLQAHTLRVLSLCFPPDHPSVWPSRPLRDSKSSGWSLLASSFSALPTIAKELWGRSPAAAAPGAAGADAKAAAAAAKKDRAFAVKRWLYVAGASVTFVVYVFASGLVQIGGDDDDDEDFEDDHA